MSSAGTQLMTAEEFAKRPDPADGSKEELIKGVVVTMSPPNARHGFISLNIGSILREFVRPKRLGWVVVESGVHVERDPDTVLGPDVSFYGIGRTPELPPVFFEVGADLVVEVLSPSDRRAAARRKIRTYIDGGARLAWLVDPEVRTVTVYPGTLRGVEYDETDILDGGDVLPGFSCRVREFFE